MNAMKLDTARISEAMARSGLSQSDVAERLQVSREAVSKWMRGESVPRPRRVLGLAQLLSLKFDDLYGPPAQPEPLVAFRKRASTRTTERDYERARDMGYQLRNLVPHLPFEVLSHPASLVAPVPQAAYVRKAANEIRRRMDLTDDVVEFSDIIAFYAEVNAILVPVMWGRKKNHENALRIHLPDSLTTWVFLNLDVKVMDFKFWMAHELAHVKAPGLHDDEGEVFADAFAAELLFPNRIAMQYLPDVERSPSPGARINKIKDIAADFVVSPVTVLSQMNQAAAEWGHSTINIDIHAATTNFHKQFRDVDEIIFGTDSASAAQYVVRCTKVFQTPFFDALRDLIATTNRGASFIQRLMSISPVDAKAVYGALKGDAAEDPA